MMELCVLLHSIFQGMISAQTIQAWGSTGTQKTIAFRWARANDILPSRPFRWTLAKYGIAAKYCI